MRPRAGRATAPATTTLSMASATCTAQSRAVELGELAGAVERIDDPHPALLEAGEVVGSLLREHAVVGYPRGQRLHQELVGAQVAGVLQLLALEAFAADLEQQRAGGGGQLGGQFVVGGSGPVAGAHWSSPRMRATISSADSSADISTVRTCTSGSSGSS